MTNLKAQIEIAATAQDAWAVLADMGNVKNFHPFVEDSYYTSHEKSGTLAVRICEFYNGMVLKESAVGWEDGKELTLAIEIEEGQKPPIDNIKSVFEVEPIDSTTTRVSMVMSYDPKGLMGKVMDPLMIRSEYSKIMPAILQGLKHHLETGETVTPATLKKIKVDAVIA